MAAEKTTARTGFGSVAPRLAVPLVLALTLAALAADRRVTARPAVEPAPAGDGEPDPAELRPEPLVPRTTRSEVDQDRLDATVLFAAARAHEQRQDDEKALRLYERAVQAEPGSPLVLRHIIVLAFNLDRRAEAARYARSLEIRNPDDALLLRRLGLELADEEDWRGALTLYERVAAAEAGDKITPNSLLLWRDMGQLYYLTEQYGLAAEQFTKIEKALANPAEAGLNDAVRKVIIGKGDLTYQLFAECYLEADQLTKAQAAFEKANEYKGAADLLAYNLARVAARRHQPADALARLEVALKHGLSSQGTEPYELLAKLLTDLGQPEQLVGRLENLRVANENNTPLTLFLAQTYRKSGKAELAEPLYRRLCTPSRVPTSLEAWQGYIALLHAASRWEDLLPVLGGALTQAGDWEPLGESGKALLADRAAVDALLEVARRQRAAGTLADHPDRSLAAALLAMSHAQYDDAGAYFDLALAAPAAKRPELLLTWGMDLMTHEQFDRAAEVFRRGCDRQAFPSASPKFYFYLSGALALADRNDDALAAARQAAELRPDAIRFDSRVGWILFRAKRYDEARAAYEQLVARFDKDPPSPETREVLHDVRLALSTIEMLQNHPDRAEAWLEDLWDEYPTDPGVLNDLGYSWADHGKHLRRSLRMIEQAVAAEPKNLAFRDSLGWVYYRLGRFPEAVTELRTATAVEKPDATVLDHLGDALLAAGDRPAACDTWRRSVAAFEADGEADKGRPVQAKIDAAAAQPAEPAPAPPSKPTS